MLGVCSLDPSSSIARELGIIRDQSNECSSSSDPSSSIARELGIIRERALVALIPPDLIPSNLKFTLEFKIGKYQQHKLCVVPTQAEIDHRTAASHALIYASWWGDLELVKKIVQDLGEIIDVNTVIGDMNVLEWVMMHVRGGKKPFTFPSSGAYEVRKKNAISICRYLVNHYGPKIDANRPGGLVLKSCAWRDSVDIVAKIIREYGENLINSCGTVWIFRLLIQEGYDDEAELFLHLNQTELSSGSHWNVLLPVTYHGSTRIFKTTLDMFGSYANTVEVNEIFRALCEGDEYEGTGIADIYPKVRAALDLWAKQLTPGTIKFCLVNLWGVSQYRRQDRNPVSRSKALATDKGENHGLASQLIVERCMGKIKGDGIQIALTVCCWPQNIKLINTVFDSNLVPITLDPRLMRHAFLECASLDDALMLRHIVEKRESEGISTVKSAHGSTIRAMYRERRWSHLSLDTRSKQHPIRYGGSVKPYYRMFCC